MSCTDYPLISGLSSGFTGMNPASGISERFEDLDTSYNDGVTPNYIYTFAAGTGAALASRAPTNTEKSRSGIWRVTAGSGANYAGWAGNYNADVFGGNERTFATAINLVQVPDATNDFEFLSGWATNGTTSANPANGVYFYIDRAESTTNWLAATGASSTDTFTDTGVAFATGWVNLRIVVNAAGTSAKFYIDGVLVATNTTNIPTDTAQKVGPGTCMHHTNGATNLSFDIDWFLLRNSNDRGTF